MKKYIKPTVEVVSLKSSENIATTFKNIRKNMVNDYLTGSNTKSYTVSEYALSNSSIQQDM